MSSGFEMEESLAVSQARPAWSLKPGHPWPLGAHWDGKGINFAITSANASAIELCLFETNPLVDQARVMLPARTGDVWHGYLPGAAPGLVYGFRAYGEWAPREGHKFNAFKLLLDPYAREIVGSFEWRDEHFGFDPAMGPLVMCPKDNALLALKARVIDEGAPLTAAATPWRTPLSDTVLYEVHVKGFTKRHPGVPEALRGTYAGLATRPVLGHLKRLGVTSVSLLPVHQHIDEQRLANMGLSNYWGYNTIGFFVPEPAYAASGVAGARDEFRAMVDALHAEGIEVILDVVFNHSAETDELGPTLSWRGLDNAGFYRLPHEARDFYENQTGCGNTFDFRQPRVLQLAMDSLRYWVQYMGVDGFRFDLAPVLARDGADEGFNRRAAFFKAALQDPALAGIKLIAEPWDIGAGGYRVGEFPAGWLEWNDRYRDAMRGFWLAGSATRADLAQRLCASAEQFRHDGRGPVESVNFIVAHDGFSLRDAVSYDHKHNLANGEGNRDGAGHNLSWNCGVEGETGDPEVLATRSRLSRALLATLMFSQGTPMICAGDELGHTQGGNNNPYCQDNETTWIDWSAADEGLVDFTARLIALRRKLLPLGIDWHEALGWLRPDGERMNEGDWGIPTERALGCLIERGSRSAAPLLLLFNSAAEGRDFRLPEGTWEVLFDSAGTPAAEPAEPGADAAFGPFTSQFPLAGRSLVLLSRHSDQPIA